MNIAIPSLADLACSDCGSADIFALSPGEDPVRSDIPLFDVLLDAGSPTVARCLACAMRKYSKLNREAGSGNGIIETK
jgi:hypothetical protein